MKAFFKSKTLWGIAAMAVPVIGPALSGAVLAMPTDGASGALSGPCEVSGLPAEAQAIVVGLGAVLAVYGRVKATGQITFK